jgi:hypothetical protein
MRSFVVATPSRIRDVHMEMESTSISLLRWRVQVGTLSALNGNNDEAVTPEGRDAVCHALWGIPNARPKSRAKPC